MKELNLIFISYYNRKGNEEKATYVIPMRGPKTPKIIGSQNTLGLSLNHTQAENAKKPKRILMTSPRGSRRLKGGGDGSGGLTEGLGSLSELGDRLGTSDTTTPLSSSLLELVTKVSLGSGNEVGKSLSVLGSDVLQGNDGGGLLVDDGTESGLVLDDNVRNTHLSAKSGEEDDELDRVNVIGDNDERCLLGLDESDTVVKTVLDEEGLLGVLGGGLVVTSLGLSLLVQSSLLLLGGLRLVLVHQLEQLGGSVLVEGVTELSDGRGDLESLVKDDLLSLESDIFGPLDESGEVLLGGDVTT